MAEAAKKAKDEEKVKRERERKEKETARLAKQGAARTKREEAETKKRAAEEQRKEKGKAKKVTVSLAIVSGILCFQFEILSGHVTFPFVHSIPFEISLGIIYCT